MRCGIRRIVNGCAAHRVMATLRANTDTGWPTGTPAFIADLETRLGRCLHRQPVSRKGKLDGNR